MRAAPSFFQSWTWIETWLDRVQAERVLLRATLAGRVVALGIVAQKAIRRRGVIPVNLISLHETGDPDLDRLAVEYNGFLIDANAPADLVPQIIKAFAAWSSAVEFGAEWDELSLPGVDERWLAAANQSGLTIEIDRADPAFAMVLSSGADRDMLLSRLSANTRAQIRRSLRRLADAGRFSVTPAGSLDEAHGWLDALATLNVERWAKTPQQSAFSQPWFTRFHHDLLRRGWPRREVDVLAIRAGGSLVGHLYNFLAGGVAHNYAAGFAGQSDPHVKPGLTCHLLAAEHYAGQGFHLYDLMVGEARFKRSLGTPHETLYWLRVQRPRLALRAEAALRAIKRRVTQLKDGARPSKRSK